MPEEAEITLPFGDSSCGPTGGRENDMSRASQVSGVLVSAVFAGCSMLLAGCSSSHPGASSGSGPGAAAPVVTHVSAITPGEAVPFTLADNARSEVTTGACTQSSGTWVLHGTVRNRATTAKTFQIVVDFVTDPGSTVLSSVEVSLPGVGPKATAPWSVTGARGRSHVACVVRQAQAS